MRKATLAFFLATLVAGSATAGSRLVAFSVAEAQRRIQAGGPIAPEAARLGGITQIMGMVYDAESGDPIVIGRAEASAPQLDLDSLVVAMRSVLALKQWPLVSIDPAPDTLTTGKQMVRLEGGIEDSRFGRDFVSADVRLKRLGLGLDHAAGIDSYFEQRKKRLAPGGAQAEGRSRFWFYAVDPGLEQQGGVFLIRSLQLGVRAQEVSLGTLTGTESKDVAAEDFARQLSVGFPELTREYPEIARLERLYELVAVARGLEMTPERPIRGGLKRIRGKPFPRRASMT